MKQVERFSIGGYAFTLDSEAAQAASDYLKEISSFYQNPEIIEGIEERMAELLLERTPKEGIVSQEAVRQIIDILGRPEKIEAEEPEQTSSQEPKPRKKLYRDMDNAKVAGVCSGLASYFDVDAMVFRAIFLIAALVSFFGGLDHRFPFVSTSFPVLYMILWVCMPAARTAKQRWEQRGEDGTAEGIRRSIESGAAEIGEAAGRIGNNPAWGRFGRAFEVTTGLLLLIVAVSGLFAEALALFGGEWLGLQGSIDRFIFDINREYPQFETIIDTPWVMGLAIAACVLPFIGILYGSIMMIFHFRSPSWHPGLVIFVLWLITLVALTILILAGVFSAEHQESFFAMNLLDAVLG